MPPPEFPETSEIDATADIQNHTIPTPTFISIRGHQSEGEPWQYRPNTATYADDYGTEYTRLIYHPICPLNTNDTRQQTLNAANTAVFPPRVRSIIQQDRTANSRDPRDWRLHSVELDAETNQVGSWNPGVDSQGVPVTLAFVVRAPKNPILEGVEKVSRAAVTIGELSEQGWTQRRVGYE